MVILQFNKLIRNKWVWGAFAFAISFFFAFDFLLTDLSGQDDRAKSGGGVGKLGERQVKESEFQLFADDARGFGRQRDWQLKRAEVNRSAWEALAAFEVAKSAGVEVTDDELRSLIRNDPSFQQNGVFSFAKYQGLLRENSVTPEQFEAFLRRRVTLQRIAGAFADGSAWVSPVELDRAVADLTDEFTFRVARFKQDAVEADAVTIDDAGIKKWYDANTNSLALPERVKLRMVKFDATDQKLQAKLTVTEDEMRDYYDANVESYTTTDTNGVEQVKPFEEVKSAIEPKLLQLAAIEYLMTNLNRRVYGVAAQPGKSRLSEIAAEDSLKTITSEWFAIDGSYHEGFTKSLSTICPGAEEFAAAVAELDNSSEDLRYGIVNSDSAVWVIEKAETSEAHTPSFAEAKSAIRPKALRQAKADAFEAKVNAILEKGADAVLAGEDVSTNLVYSICDLKPGDLPDFQAVAGALRSLNKGEVSKFTRVGYGAALAVVCLDRKSGDAVKAVAFRERVQRELAMMKSRRSVELWRQWNLKYALGFEPTEASSVEEEVAEIE